MAKAQWVQTRLTAQANFGWVPIICGAAVLVAVLVLPEVHTRRAIGH
jgi:hypothetical protein